MRPNSFRTGNHTAHSPCIYEAKSAVEMSSGAPVKPRPGQEGPDPARVFLLLTYDPLRGVRSVVDQSRQEWEKKSLPVCKWVLRAHAGGRILTHCALGAPRF